MSEQSSKTPPTGTRTQSPAVPPRALTPADQLASQDLPAILANLRQAAKCMRSTPPAKLEVDEVDGLEPLALFAEYIASDGDWALKLLGIQSSPSSSGATPPTEVQDCKKQLAAALKGLEQLLPAGVSSEANAKLQEMQNDIGKLQTRIAASVGRNSP